MIIGKEITEKDMKIMRLQEEIDQLETRKKVLEEDFVRVIDKLREIEDCGETLEGTKREIRSLVEEYT